MARSSGYNTKTRQLILTFLLDNRQHAVSAANILAHLESEGAAASATTVYRYLERLEGEGRILKYVADKGEKAVYQYVGDRPACHEHLHLKCVRCGQIYHLDCGFMDEVRAHLEKEHGFALQCEGSMLYGVCRRCRETAALSGTGAKKIVLPVDTAKKP